MKNKLDDLNNHLFAQLERLSDEDLKGEALKDELSRARAIVNVSDQITTISGQKIAAVKICAVFGDRHRKSLPSTIEHEAPILKMQKL